MPEVAHVFCGVCPSHWQGYSQEIEKKISVCWLDLTYNVLMESFDINFVEERTDSLMY